MLSHYVPIKECGDFFCIFCEVSGHGEEGLFRCFGASIDDAKVHSQEVGSDLKKDVVGPSLPLHLLLPVVSPRNSWQSLFMDILLRELEISSDVRDFGGVLVVFRKFGHLPFQVQEVVDSDASPLQVELYPRPLTLLQGGVTEAAPVSKSVLVQL